MIDPRKAAEDLRRSQFRLDVLDLLIEIADASDEVGRSLIDAKIWKILAQHGVARDAAEAMSCAAFCRGEREFESYSKVVEMRLASILD